MFYFEGKYFYLPLVQFIHFNISHCFICCIYYKYTLFLLCVCVSLQDEEDDGDYVDEDEDEEEDGGT